MLNLLKLFCIKPYQKHRSEVVSQSQSIFPNKEVCYKGTQHVLKAIKD